MKISIITTVLNGRDTVAHTIESVLSQTHQDIEYIVIDASSIDGTIEVIRQFEDRLSVFVSEPDKGIYDGLNKGIKLATGDVIGILNADDFYIDNKVIAKISKVFEDKKVDSVFADLIFVQANNPQKVVRYFDSGWASPKRFSEGWMPAHPTFFVKKAVYKKYGAFRTDFKISADFDIAARFLYAKKISYHYIQTPLVVMRTGGVSTHLLNRFFVANIEILRACKYNGIKTNWFKILYRYPQKIIELLQKNNLRKHRPYPVTLSNHDDTTNL